MCLYIIYIYSVYICLCGRLMGRIRKAVEKPFFRGRKFQMELFVMQPIVICWCHVTRIDASLWAHFRAFFMLPRSLSLFPVFVIRLQRTVLVSRMMEMSIVFLSRNCNASACCATVLCTWCYSIKIRDLLNLNYRKMGTQV